MRAASFGGGGPLEYAPIFDVLAELRGTLFRSLTTNRLRLDDATFARLVRAKPDEAHVSIHFPKRASEVERVIGQVHALERAGIRSGVNPVEIEELPADVATKAIVYDGSFAGAAAPIQPAEIWQRESWQPNWLATDGKTVRPFPGRLDEMDDVAENLEGQGELVVLRASRSTICCAVVSTTARGRRARRSRSRSRRPGRHPRSKETSRNGCPSRSPILRPGREEAVVEAVVTQHSTMLTARPPRAVSLYFVSMSAPV